MDLRLPLALVAQRGERRPRGLRAPIGVGGELDELARLRKRLLELLDPIVVDRLRVLDGAAGLFQLLGQARAQRLELLLVALARRARPRAPPRASRAVR
jgi:hypothetical protein